MLLTQCFPVSIVIYIHGWWSQLDISLVLLTLTHAAAISAGVDATISHISISLTKISYPFISLITRTHLASIHSKFQDSTFTTSPKEMTLFPQPMRNTLPWSCLSFDHLGGQPPLWLLVSSATRVPHLLSLPNHIWATKGQSTMLLYTSLSISLLSWFIVALVQNGHCQGGLHWVLMNLWSLHSLPDVECNSGSIKRVHSLGFKSIPFYGTSV